MFFFDLKGLFKKKAREFSRKSHAEKPTKFGSSFVWEEFKKFNWSIGQMLIGYPIDPARLIRTIDRTNLELKSFQWKHSMESKKVWQVVITS